MAEVFARLRGPSMIGFPIYLVFEIVEASIPSGNSLLRDILDATRDVLLVPFCIAIYRLLILGEITSQYSFWIFIPSFQRLLGWTIGLSAVINLPPHVVNLIASSEATRAIATVVLLS
jgi:asparagine N-glycosylation enzyme membrane subunit Stt3